MTDTNPEESVRMAYRVEYLVNDRPYAASLDSLRDALLFAAVHQGDEGVVLKITGPDELLLEGDDLVNMIGNPPPAPAPPVDDPELEP